MRKTIANKAGLFLPKGRCPQCDNLVILIEDLPRVWRGFCGICNYLVVENKNAGNIQTPQTLAKS